MSNADRIVKALQEHPELLRDVLRKLQDGCANQTHTCWYVQKVEHEFGQRDDGWTLWGSKAEADKFQKSKETEGRAEQYWTYETPKPITVDAEVGELLLTLPKLHGRGNHPPTHRNPSTGRWEPVLITAEHLVEPAPDK